MFTIVRHMKHVGFLNNRYSINEDLLQILVSMTASAVGIYGIYASLSKLNEIPRSFLWQLQFKRSGFNFCASSSAVSVGVGLFWPLFSTFNILPFSSSSYSSRNSKFSRKLTGACTVKRAFSIVHAQLYDFNGKAMASGSSRVFREPGAMADSIRLKRPPAE